MYFLLSSGNVEPEILLHKKRCCVEANFHVYFKTWCPDVLLPKYWFRINTIKCVQRCGYKFLKWWNPRTLLPNKQQQRNKILVYTNGRRTIFIVTLFTLLCKVYSDSYFRVSLIYRIQPFLELYQLQISLE